MRALIIGSEDLIYEKREHEINYKAKTNLTYLIIASHSQEQFAQIYAKA